MQILTTISIAVKLVPIHTEFRGIFEDMMLMDMIEDQTIVTIESASLVYREGIKSTLTFTLHNSSHVMQSEGEAFEQHVLAELESRHFLA